MVWSQFFGCVSFELFGHFKGTVRNANRFFAFVVDEAAEPGTAARVSHDERTLMQLVYPLLTERLLIRALTPDDVDRHYALFSDPDVVRYLYFGPFDRAGAQEHLARRSIIDLPEEGGWINFGLEVQGEGVLIGELAMGFISATHGHYEVGYVLDPAYAGHGYATEGAARSSNWPSRGWERIA